MKRFTRSTWTYKITVLVAILALLAVPIMAFAAELLTAELTAPINDVTVTQGGSASFTISVSAIGAIKCVATSVNPATATVHTVYSIDSTGVLSSGTPSSALNFFAGAPIGGPNCSITWTGALTLYAVSASVSAAATTPVGNYTITLSPAAGTTTVSTPSGSGGSLDDGIATTIAVHVVAPPNTPPTSPGVPYLSSGSNPNNSGVFTLSWAASTDNESNPITYLLQHKDADDVSYSTVASGLTTNSYTFTSGSPEAEGTWVYRVQASDGSLSSAFSGDSTPIVVDKTPPGAPMASASTINGSYTSGTWTNKDVSVSFTANGDPYLQDGSVGSGGVTCTGPGTLTTETTGTVVSGTCTDAAGNTSATASITVKIDKTAPNAPTANVSPIPNGAGWNNSTPVTVSFGDNGDAGAVQSGVASCSSPTSLTSETAGTVVSGTCTDVAGNPSAATSVTVKIDITNPNAPSANVSPAPNDAGWNNSTPVTVSFSGNGDAGTVQSGVASCIDLTSLTSETAGTLVNGTCTDVAGNTSDATSVTVKIDTTKPNAPSLSPDRIPDYSGGGGWYKDTVTISFSDNGDAGPVQSGVNPSSVPSPVTFNTSGPHTASGTVKDNADNESALTSLTVQVDATKPTVNIICPSSAIILGSSANASWTAIDAHSGLATPASGAVALDTSTVGSKTATAPTATDNVGHDSDPVTCTYSVIYNWSGFFQPIDNLPTVNVVQAGRGIPVKFSLSGNQGLGILASGYPVSTWTACGTTTTDVVESTVTAGSSSLSYDATADQYIYVWKTDKAWASSCRTLTVKLIDGTIHQANFKFTK